MLLRDLRARLVKYISGRLAEDVPESLRVEEPRNRKFGDLSTNAAMVLSPVVRKSPMEISSVISDEISDWEEVENVRTVKPGFINFDLREKFLIDALAETGRQKEDYGTNDSGNGIRINLEYVSSNPTGDLHIGHGRWGALGDVLSNIYMANGYTVCREYYVNDYGSQAAKFAECAAALYLGHFGYESVYPEDGYPPEAVSIAVDRLIETSGNIFLDKEGRLSEPESFKKKIINTMVERIAETLEKMDVRFDNWFYESSLYRKGNFQRILRFLREKDLVYNNDDAVWFRSTGFGDEKDRVVVRSGGEPTYFASDIMYLEDKAGRGFDRIIYILGADHHGYVDRLTAIGKALGIGEEKLMVIIGQLVNIIKDGMAVRMSRRKGKVYTLRDLIDDVGKDAVRYFFTGVSCDTPMDFDIGLARRRSNQNPVYYIQYAHARIESIFKKIEQEGPGGLSRDDINIDNIDFSDIEFKNRSEKGIAKALLLYPDAVFNSCENNAPHILSQYLLRLAAEFHQFYNKHRIIEVKGGTMSVNRSRLALVLLVRQVLKNALKILNISAPEKM
jgi:arginyl-tRNA synthetase